MTGAAVLAVLSCSGLMAWWGYGHGRRLVMAGGLWLIATVIGLGTTAWIWMHVGLNAWGLGLMVLQAVVLAISLHLLRKRWRGRDAGSQPWRYAGLILGLGTGPLVSLCFGLLFWTASPPVPEPGDADPWLSVRTFGQELAGLSTDLMGELPIIGPRSRDLTALVQILNTPQPVLAAYAREHEIATLSELPVIRAALLDDSLVSDITLLSQGDMTRLRSLWRSSHLTAMLADPHVRNIVDGFDLHALAASLAEQTQSYQMGEQPQIDLSAAPTRDLGGSSSVTVLTSIE